MKDNISRPSKTPHYLLFWKCLSRMCEPGPCTVNMWRRAALYERRATVSPVYSGDVAGGGAPARADGVKLCRGRSSDHQHQPGRAAGREMVAAAQSVRCGLPGESCRANHRVSFHAAEILHRIHTLKVLLVFSTCVVTSVLQLWCRKHITWIVS